MIRKSDIFSCLVQNSSEIQELYVGRKVARIEGAPTALAFHRNFVSKNCPCIFENTAKHLPAIEKWNQEYLAKTLGDRPVTVAVTPNGYADSVSDGKFFLPDEKEMTISQFFQCLNGQDKSKGKGVYYIQKQNSNLTDEFKGLFCDMDEDISWATEAFGKNPDAVNFWMGGASSVTSLHKDHYENLYLVVCGSKTFTLYPPTDRPFIPYRKYDVYKYCQQDEKWDTIKTGDSVPWIAVDPLRPDFDTYPCFANATPITCTVNAGEILYLPALWFHHVQQSDDTIAVNYWYDMDFDMKYAFYQLLDKLTVLIDKDS